MTFRIRSDLREKIKLAAETTGRSVSEEIELILELNLLAGRIRIRDQEPPISPDIEPEFQKYATKIEDNNALVQAILKSKMILAYARLSCVEDEVISDITECQKMLLAFVTKATDRISSTSEDMLKYKSKVNSKRE